MLFGLIAMLVVAVLSQFGVELRTTSEPAREVHRMTDCPDPPPPALAFSSEKSC